MADGISKTKKTDKELCQIIATSVTDIVRNSLNPTFRQNYFDAIKVTNSTDAQNVVENRLLNLLNKNEISCKKHNTENNKLFVEHYIASKILRPSDAANTQKYFVMISLIQQLLKIDSKLDEQIKKTRNFISPSIFPYNILENVESTFEHKESEITTKRKKSRKE